MFMVNPSFFPIYTLSDVYLACITGLSAARVPDNKCKKETTAMVSLILNPAMISNMSPST